MHAICAIICDRKRMKIANIARVAFTNVYVDMDLYFVSIFCRKTRDATFSIGIVTKCHAPLPFPPPPIPFFEPATTTNATTLRVRRCDKMRCEKFERTAIEKLMLFTFRSRLAVRAGERQILWVHACTHACVYAT